MKIFYLIAFSIILSIVSCANPNEQAPEEEANHGTVCNYIDYTFPTSNSSLNLNYDSVVYSVIEKLSLDGGVSGINDLSVSSSRIERNLSANIDIRNCSDRHIIYNRSFLDSLYLINSSYAPIVSAVLHEIGHIMYVHPVKALKTTRNNELIADRFSGFYMKILDYSLPESLVAISKFGHLNRNTRYPEVIDRLKQIEIGWYSASLQLNEDFCDDFTLEELNDLKELLGKVVIDKCHLSGSSTDNQMAFLDKIHGIQNIEINNGDNIIIVINTPYKVLENGNIISFETGKKVGELFDVSNGLPYEVIKIEGNKFFIEEGMVFNILPGGIKFQLGYKFIAKK